MLSVPQTVYPRDVLHSWFVEYGFSALSDREALVLQCTVLAEDDGRLTYTKMARELGLSKARVPQVALAAQQKLARYVLGKQGVFAAIKDRGGWNPIHTDLERWPDSPQNIPAWPPSNLYFYRDTVLDLFASIDV